jgi:hypothetical protein
LRDSKGREKVKHGLELGGSWNQEWLYWRGPTATYPTDRRIVVAVGIYAIRVAAKKNNRGVSVYFCVGYLATLISRVHSLVDVMGSESGAVGGMRIGKT